MIAEDINKHIDKFTNIEDMDSPADERITVFCDDGFDDVGFVEDTYFKELGLNMFIAKKWILQSELNELIKKDIYEK